MKTSPTKGTVFLSIASLVFIVSGYIINVLLGRFLGPEGYGIYGVIISLVALINIIQTTGITQAVSKHVAESKIDINSVLKSGLILQTILNLFFFFIFFFFAGNIASVFKDLQLIPYLKITAFVFPIYGLYALYMDFYNGLHFFKKQALMNILYSLSKLVFILGLAFFFKITGVFFGLILSPLISILIGIKLPDLSIKRYPLKKLLIFSVPLIGIAIFSNLILSVDLFLIKIFLPSKIFPGLYTASQNIARLIFYSMTAINLVIFPSISHAVSNQLHERTKNLIRTGIRIMLFFIIPSVLVISATSSELIDFIYSSRYISASSSLSILVFGMGAFTLFTGINYILSGAGKPHVASLFSFIGLSLSIVFCYLLIPSYKLEGAALATTIGSSVSLCIATFYLIYNFHSFAKFSSIIRILVGSIIIYLIAKLIIVPVLLLPLFYIILFSLYIGLLFLLKEITQDDIKMVSDLLPKWLVNKVK